MPDSASSNLPCVVFFNINGNGTGHLSTCLAYANRMRGRARPVFFSLASAIEVIHDMGFEADYFVSRFWSRATSWAWDRQLALRLGLLLERVRPRVIVFDGNWPYRGLFAAAEVYGEARLVWSNLMLFRPDVRDVPVRESEFDLVIRLGEIGTRFSIELEGPAPRKIIIPPVTILRDEELLARDEARSALGLQVDGRYALVSLGPGNLKDVTGIGRGLIDELKARGYAVVWTRAPIAAKETILPRDVMTISAYPLARYMRAFDVFVGAAGYNTCSEVLQSGVPTLFVPNRHVSDDQARRAEHVAQTVPAVVSSCESAEQRADAVWRVLAFVDDSPTRSRAFGLTGAERAAEEILALAEAESRPVPSSQVYGP